MVQTYSIGPGTACETEDACRGDDPSGGETDAFQRTWARQPTPADCDGGAPRGHEPCGDSRRWGGHECGGQQSPMAYPVGHSSRGHSSQGHSEAALYRQLSNDVNATGTDKRKLEIDAAKLEVVAGANGQVGLARAARNIANSLNNGSYDQHGSSVALAKAAPGTNGAVTIPAGAGAYANALGIAASRLERDVDQGSHTSREDLVADANLVKTLATKAGEKGLAAAAGNIVASLDDGSYNQLASLEALERNPAKNSDYVGGG